MKRVHKDVHISVLVQEKVNEISWEYTVPNTTDEDTNHGIVFTLKSHWPPHDLGQLSCLSSSDTDLMKTYTKTIFTLFKI